MTALKAKPGKDIWLFGGGGLFQSLFEFQILLVRLGLICRPELDRAMAQEAGAELEEESGFGTGLCAAIERQHGWRRDFQAVFR